MDARRQRHTISAMRRCHPALPGRTAQASAPDRSADAVCRRRISSVVRETRLERMVSTRPSRTTDTPSRASTRANASPRGPLRSNHRGACISVVDVSLVVTVLAVALGLAMVETSLTFGDHPAGHAPPSGPARIAQRSEARPVRLAGVVLTESLARSTEEAWEQQSKFRSMGMKTGPSTSPLFPQNGVTLWDRIRVSSKRDVRAFLLGTAIQIHAPATAATPGPRFASPPSCPR
jgi:hypothetical protein